MTDVAGEQLDQLRGTETVEKLPPKCLFVDDYASLVTSYNILFRSKYPNFTAVECHTVEEAMTAIATNQPRILFLDHHLTDPISKGHEGLEIADQVIAQYPDIKIFSTTTDPNVVERYVDRGIGRIKKDDIVGIQAIVSGEKE